MLPLTGAPRPGRSQRPAMAGLLARGTAPVAPAFPVSQWRLGAGSPPTVAGAAAELVLGSPLTAPRSLLSPNAGDHRVKGIVAARAQARQGYGGFIGAPILAPTVFGAVAPFGP